MVGRAAATIRESTWVAGPRRRVGLYVRAEKVAAPIDLRTDLTIGGNVVINNNALLSQCQARAWVDALTPRPVGTVTVTSNLNDLPCP